MLGEDGAALMAAIPHNRKKPYDPKLYVERIVDEESLFEIGPDWGKEHRTVSFDYFLYLGADFSSFASLI